MKTKKDIIKAMVEEMPFRFDVHTLPYIEEAMEVYAKQQVKDNVVLPDVSGSAYICKNVNGEDAIIIAENIAEVFDKLEDMTPTPDNVEVAGKSTQYYR